MKYNIFNMKHILFLFTLLVLHLNIFAQKSKIAGYQLFTINDRLNPPNYPGDEMLKNYEEFNTEHRVWVVFSDRSSNATYAEPHENASLYKQMNFMEEFFVISEKNDYLHIVKRNLDAIQSTKRHLQEINDGFENDDYGWVPKKNLLLSNKALVNENKFSVKALPVLKDPDAFLDHTKYLGQNGTLLIYNSPLRQSNPNDNVVKMFQFLYVYKLQNGRVLVGKTPMIQLENASQFMLGWMDTNIIQIWPNSICIWPNQNPDAITERKAKNIKASLFKTTVDAQSWSSGTNEKIDEVWNDDPYDSKVIGNTLRMPILSKLNNIIETGNVTDVRNLNGETIQTTDVRDSTINSAEKIIENIRRINLVFIVDGSPDIAPYLNSIKAGLQTIANAERKRAGSSKYKNRIYFSAVIYRKNQDVNCRNGNMAVCAMKNFSESYSEIEDFIIRQSKLNSCNTDITLPHALYSALEIGLRKFATETNQQTNIIALIGGQGDVANRGKETTLAKDISFYNAGVIAYQVVNGASPNYTYFHTQLNRIIKKADSIAAGELKARRTHTFTTLNTDWHEESWGDDNSGTKEFLKYPQSSPLLGAIIYPKEGTSMSEGALPIIIANVVDTQNRVIDKNIAEIENSMSANRRTPSKNMNPSFIRYMNVIGRLNNMSDEEIMAYLNGDVTQFFIKGYTAMNHSKLRFPLYERVLFTTDDELYTLIHAFQDLDYNASTIYEIRQKLQEAMKKIVATYVGDENAPKIIENMSIEQFQNLITGLEPKNSILKYNLRDFMNERRVSDDAVKNIAKHFRNTHLKLVEISKNGEYNFRREEMNFYWIPESVFSD